MSRFSDWRALLAKQGWPEGRDVTPSTYYKREKALRKDGFLDFEVAHFATGAIGTPGMRAMRRERRMWFRRAKEEGIGREEWEDRVMRKYKRNGWLFPEASSIAGAYNPWEYLEHIREKRGDRGIR